jgi:anaerobic selenocysteine-containing dehydrogenase
MATETKKTLCNRDCPDVCQIVATVEDGRITKIQGDKDHPVTRGFLCPRTSRFLETQYSPERVTSPLIRRGDRLEPASWDEALDLIASRLVQIKRESGPAAIFHYKSGGAMGMLKHLTTHFFNLFGPATFKTGDICTGAGEWAQNTDFGDYESNDIFDVLKARNIVLWGKNVYVSSPHLIPVLRDAKANGAGLVLIDPVHHRSAELCEQFWQPRPGGDFALAMAVARLIFERGWQHPDAARWCDHLDAFRALAFEHDVASWCAQADVGSDCADDLAQRYHAGPTTTLVGWGMGRRLNGAGIVRALDALGAITGNIGIPGAAVSFETKRPAPFDMSWLSNDEPRSISEPLFGEQVLAASDPPIRAVWIHCANPVAMLPDSATIARALASREFVVVVDPFLTDTAALAHVVLPTTTLLEDDDILGSYGHHFVGVSQPVVPPPPGVRSDLDIIQGLATRTGLGEALAGDARTWKRRMMTKLEARGVTLEALERAPQRSPFAAEVVHAERMFKTPSGKANLVTDSPPPPTLPTAAFPLVLLSCSTDKSQASQWAREPTGPIEVTIHPDAANGLADGELARLESAIGSIAVRVRFDRRQRCDVALVPKGGHFRKGMAANALIRARLSDHGGGAALYDELVRLVRA